MTNFIQEGIKSIKETKTYATQKNIPNWKTHIFYAVLTTWLGSLIIVISSIKFLPSVILENKLFYSLVGPIYPYLPFILTAIIMIHYGKYPIKFLLLFTFYITKGLMKLINKGDMYLWRKTGKDSVISNFIQKHSKLVKFIFMIPLVLELLFYMKW